MPKVTKAYKVLKATKAMFIFSKNMFNLKYGIASFRPKKNGASKANIFFNEFTKINFNRSMKQFCEISKQIDELASIVCLQEVCEELYTLLFSKYGTNKCYRHGENCIVIPYGWHISERAVINDKYPACKICNDHGHHLVIASIHFHYSNVENKAEELNGVYTMIERLFPQSPNIIIAGDFNEIIENLQDDSSKHKIAPFDLFDSKPYTSVYLIDPKIKKIAGTAEVIDHITYKGVHRIAPTKSTETKHWCSIIPEMDNIDPTDTKAVIKFVKKLPISDHSGIHGDFYIRH